MFTKLLVPLDRSPLAEQAVGYAAAIARACHADVDVVLVHETEQFSVLGDEPAWAAGRVRDDEHYLRDVAGALAAECGAPTTHAVLRGDVATSITARALDGGASLVVMTTHGRTGLSRAWLGSIADAVMRHSGIPVLMLRPVQGRSSRLAPPELFRRILVPLDGSPESLGVLDAAAALARCTGARVLLLRVVRPVPLVMADASTALLYPALIPDDGATAGLAEQAAHQLEQVARLLGEMGCAQVEQHVVVDDRVAQAVLDFARAYAADVIAMSTHGRGASRLLVGSMADKVVRASDCPVLLVRPPAAGASAPTLHAATTGATAPLFSIA